MPTFCLQALMHLCQKHSEIICVLFDCHNGSGDEVLVVIPSGSDIFDIYIYTFVSFLKNVCTKNQGLDHI
jgi:hypothetical protein